MKNHYHVLELDKNCTAKEIKESYIKLSKKYHPDRNKSKEAQKKIVEINEAYSVLKNTSTRYQYDERLQWNDKRQQNYETVHQNRGGYYTRFYTYDDYVKYQRNHYQMNRQAHAEPPIGTRKLTAVICCCMLMVFGAGLRVMYAWTEAYRRKRLNEMAARNFATSRSTESPKLEKFRQFLKGKQKGQLDQKKSES